MQPYDGVRIGSEMSSLRCVPLYHEGHRIPATDRASVVVSLGSVRYSPDAAITNHAHSAFQLVLLCSGHCGYKCTENEFGLEKGSFCFAKPGEFHELFGKGIHEWDFIYMAVNAFIPYETDGYFWRTKIRCLHNCFDLAPSFIGLFRNLSEHNCMDTDMATRRLTEELFTEISRRISKEEKIEAQKSYKKELMVAREYIDKSAVHGLSKDDVCVNTGIPETELKHQFSEDMDTTIGRYMRNALMRKAEDMLRKGYAVSFVAEKLGFPSVQYFSVAFNKYFGVRPSRFQTDTRLKYMCPASW
jgi:AraC-like DNA-binding protein